MCLFWTQRKIFWRMRETEQFWGTIDFHSIFFPSIEVNDAPKQPDYKLTSKYLPLCSEQTHSYRFGSTWGWVNDDRIFIFGWTVPLRLIWMWLVLVWVYFWLSGWLCVFLTDQHVFGQPALLFSDAGRDTESEALLPQQWVSSVSAAKRHDAPLVRDVSDEREIRVTRPVIDQRL